MLKSRMEIIIYTRRGRVIYTRWGMPQHDTWYYTWRGYYFYINRLAAEIDRISYLAYGYTGNCITRGMTILYFQFTLYSNRDSKEPTTYVLHQYVQPEPICQPSGHAL